MEDRLKQERTAEGFAVAGLVAIIVISTAWWALALWPVAGSAPEWLARTRYACFGIGDSGLPDAAGWIGLFGSPLGALGILVAAWGGHLRRAIKRHAGTRRGRLVMGASTAALLGIGHFFGTTVHEARAATAPLGEGAPTAGSFARLERPAPAMALVDQSGARRSLADLRGRPALVTFAFAHCESVCPLLVRDALQAQAMLRERGVRTSLVVVTLDPWRDTPARLPALARDWGVGTDGWVLSGEVAEVQAVLDAWSVPRGRDEQTGEVAHPALTYVVDPKGRIAFATNAAGNELLVALVERSLD